MAKNKKIKTFLIDNLYYIAGSTLYSLALYTFALHANFAPGGVSGLSILINHYTGLPIGILSLLINVPLVLLSLKVVGHTFLLKSIWAMLINTLFLDVIFPYFPFPLVYRGNPLLAAMFTGVLLGAGLAIIYMRGSSTGGADFIIMAVKKWKPHISVGKISLATDLIVILAGGLVFKNADAVLYGIIASFGCTLMMDNVLYGAGSGKLAIIITNCGNTIAAAIAAEVGRGSTLVKATGTYTGQGRDMLYCACGKNEIYKVRSTALALDPDAMVMITEASEVFGEGFEPPAIPGNEIPPSPDADKTEQP